MSEAAFTYAFIINICAFCFFMVMARKARLRGEELRREMERTLELNSELASVGAVQKWRLVEAFSQGQEAMRAEAAQICNKPLVAFPKSMREKMDHVRAAERVSGSPGVSVPDHHRVQADLYGDAPPDGRDL